MANQVVSGLRSKLRLIRSRCSILSNSLAGCQIVTKDREAFIRKSVKSLLEELDPHQFIQIHRGTLINVSFIDVVERQSLRGMQVHLRNHAVALPVAQPYQAVFRGM